MVDKAIIQDTQKKRFMKKKLDNQFFGLNFV